MTLLIRSSARTVLSRSRSRSVGGGVDGDDGVVAAHERLNRGGLQLDELIHDGLVLLPIGVAQDGGAQRSHAFEGGGEQA